MKKAIITAVLLALTLAAWGQTVPGARLYLMGNDKSGAYYIRDGVRTALPGASAFATAMVVDGGNVYIAGEYKDSSGAEQSCYWKDGALQGTVGGPHTRSKGIAVSGGRVYIFGYSTAGVRNINNAPHWYWVNGTRYDVPITMPSAQSSGGSIIVSNGTPYIAGEHGGHINEYGGRSGTDGGYWANGTIYSLPNASCIYYLAVSGSRIYAAGSNKNYNANYWIDDRQYPVEGNAPSVFSLAVSDGKVYLAGNYRINNNTFGACYWIDGRRYNLPGTNATALSIAVFQGKVYAAGYEQQWINNTSIRRACYWADGTQYFIPGENGWLKGIAVTGR